ncbi:MAG: hypothetical protein Q7S13_04130, partial [Candidatus Omnitrophota bacterium]|nr:hypothetical protein [Candidatus Omnitrophota bacterium]
GALSGLKNPPNVLLSGSAIGVYGSVAGDQHIDENSPCGQDFLASVCQQWEKATVPAQQAGIRVVHLRTATVLSRSVCNKQGINSDFRI